jgi:hypothetical protein
MHNCLTSSFLHLQTTNQNTEARDNVSSVPVTAWVTIHIPPPVAITAVNDTYYATFNQPYSPPSDSLILANDSSPNASPQLQVIWSGAVLVGTGSLVNWTASGSFEFQPATDWSGEGDQGSLR